MNKFFIILSCLCLTSIPAFAEDEVMEDVATQDKQTIDLDAVTANSTMIKAEEYLQMTKPIRQEAHRQAKTLSEKEINAMVDAQNYVNRRLAEKNNEPIPEKITIDATDQEAVEEFLTPKNLYTYDDLPTKLEYDDFK